MATPHTLEKPKTRERIITLVLAGQSDAQIAAALKTPRRTVTRQAITEFRKRHADVLKPAIAEALKKATDYAIGQKVMRVAAKDQRWQLMEQVRLARAGGGTGVETGLVVRTLKMIGTGREAQVIEEFKIDDGWLAAMNQLERGAFDETDAPTKGGSATLELEDGDGNKVRFSLNLGTEATDDHD